MWTVFDKTIQYIILHRSHGKTFFLDKSTAARNIQLILELLYRIQTVELFCNGISYCQHCFTVSFSFSLYTTDLISKFSMWVNHWTLFKQRLHQTKPKICIYSTEWLRTSQSHWLSCSIGLYDNNNMWLRHVHQHVSLIELDAAIKHLMYSF